MTDPGGSPATPASPASPGPAAKPAAGAAPEGFALDVSLEEGFRQTVTFDWPEAAALLVDEPPPLGGAAGPNPARLLGAAVASCLGASLVFCLRKARVEVQGLHTHVEGEVTRNERGRLRVSRLRVRLEPVVAAEEQPRMTRCLEVFEDFCVVTASVRQGIDVEVAVEPRAP